MEDCKVAGYNVSRGTRLIVNVWKIQRDPKVYKEPNEFRPERFITGEAKGFDVKGQNFELMPFGSGRRSCPGSSLAMQVLYLGLARFLHSFDVGTVLDLGVDMSESPGLTIPKATPLEVLISPRLKDELFG